MDDEQETVLCVANLVTGNKFIYSKDVSGDIFELIRPDGQKANLEKRLFRDDEIEVPISELHREQIEAYYELINKIETTNNRAGGIEYEAARLTFIKRHIERLKSNEYFTIICRDGHFKMTKAQFYADFPNVAGSKSYRDYGSFNYPTTPHRAYKYRVDRR